MDAVERFDLGTFGENGEAFAWRADAPLKLTPWLFGLDDTELLDGTIVLRGGLSLRLAGPSGGIPLTGLGPVGVAEAGPRGVTRGPKGAVVVGEAAPRGPFGASTFVWMGAGCTY